MGPATPHWLRCLGETGFKKIHTITRHWWIQWRRLKGNRKGRTGSYKHHKREWKNSGDFWLVKALGISQKPAKTSLTLREVQTPWRRERKTEKINVHPHKRIHLLEFRLTLITRVSIAPSSSKGCFGSRSGYRLSGKENGKRRKASWMWAISRHSATQNLTTQTRPGPESASEGKDSLSLTRNATLGLRLDPATDASRRVCCEGTNTRHLV